MKTLKNTHHLTAFDVLNYASGELSQLFTDCYCDYSLWLSLANRAETVYKKGFVNKGHKGSIAVFFEVKTTKNGIEYPFISINVALHGKYEAKTVSFNGYQWLKDNGYLTSSTNSDKQAELERQRQERAKQQAELEKQRQERAKQKLEEEKARTIARFNRFNADFENLPSLSLDTFNGCYLANKGFLFDNLPNEFIFKRGHDQRGGFIAYSLKNARHKIVGFQKIYDEKFIDHDKPRDKDFIFLPDTKNGSFIIIGKIKTINDTVYLVEGLATGLSVHLATKQAVIVCLDAGNISHVAKHFKHLNKLIIAADNDINLIKGNTGIYKALITAKELNLKIVYPELNGTQCDFDDVRQKLGIDAVKKQIKENSIDVNNKLTPIEYYTRLIKTIPQHLKTDLEKHIKSYAFLIATSTINQADIIEKTKPLQSIINQRGLTLDNENINIANHAKWFFDIAAFKTKKDNQIINYAGIVKDDFNNRALKEIANFYQGENNKEILLLNSGMGSGKTEAMAALVKRVKKYSAQYDKAIQITCVTHRTALCKDLSHRLGLAYYEDVDWINGDRSITLVTTLNSIKNHDVANRVNVLLIDEVRQTLDYGLNGTVDNRLEVYTELENAIKNADFVVCADADLNQLTLNWLKSIANKPIRLITQDQPPSNKSIIELNKLSSLLHQVKTDLLQGDNIWFSTDSLIGANHVFNFLISDTELNLNKDDVLLVHSENKADDKQAAFLANPNQESKNYKVIIHTPIISSGVSITNDHFKAVYASFRNIIAPNEMLQTIARVRPAKTIYCAFKTGHQKNRVTNVKDLIEGEEIKRGRFSKNGVLELNEFDKLRLEMIATRNHALNSFRPYFLRLALLKGYQVIECQHDNALNDNELKIETDLKKISPETKIELINDILNAEIIDTKEANRIEKLTATTQKEANALKRYKIAQLTGKEQTEINHDDLFIELQELEPKDVEFIEFNNGGRIIANYELITANIEDLKKDDLANHETRTKLTSKTSKHLLLNTIIEDCERLGLLNDEKARGVCKFLQAHHKELAINGLGNYEKINHSSIKQLRALLKKIGYDLNQVKQDENGIRWYSIAVNEQVKAYALARAAQKQRKAEIKDNEW